MIAGCLFALVLAACGGGSKSNPAPAPAPTPTTGTFRFVNDSGKSILYLYLWPSSQGTTPQGTDKLGANILAAGGIFDVTNVPCDTNMYYYAETDTAPDGSFYYWTDVGGTGPKSVTCGGTYTWTLGTGTLSPPTTQPTTGTLSVYISVDTGGGYVSLVVDGSSVHTFTNYYTSTPTCGAATGGYIYTTTVSAGNHSVSASNSNTTWPTGTIYVAAGGCSLYKLY